MKGLFSAAAATTAAVALLVGCGHKGSELSAAELKAFDSAPAETKQMWVAALGASKTNDYVGGQTLFYKLLGGDLSPEQRAVVSKESTALNERLYAAFEKGDPEAKKAIEELRQNQANRPR
jgi:hypothetical protein